MKNLRHNHRHAAIYQKHQDEPQNTLSGCNKLARSVCLSRLQEKNIDCDDNKLPKFNEIMTDVMETVFAYVHKTNAPSYGNFKLLSDMKLHLLPSRNQNAVNTLATHIVQHSRNIQRGFLPLARRQTVYRRLSQKFASKLSPVPQEQRVDKSSGGDPNQRPLRICPQCRIKLANQGRNYLCPDRT